MPTKGAPTPEQFIPLYERALSQGWDAVAALVHEGRLCDFLDRYGAHRQGSRPTGFRWKLRSYR